MSTQKGAPVQVHLISQKASLVGHSFMFPKGSEVFIQKRVDDLKNKKSVYQGLHFKGNTVVEVQFDASTLKHTHYHENPERNIYKVTLDIDKLDLSGIPEVPIFD